MYHSIMQRIFLTLRLKGGLQKLSMYGQLGYLTYLGSWCYHRWYKSGRSASENQSFENTYKYGQMKVLFGLFMKQNENFSNFFAN